MSEADGVRAYIEGALDGLAQAVLLVKELEEKIDDVTGTVLIVGLTDSKDSAVNGTLHLGQMTKTNIDEVLNNLFELRERLTLYRDKP